MILGKEHSGRKEPSIFCLFCRLCLIQLMNACIFFFFFQFELSSVALQEFSGCQIIIMDLGGCGIEVPGASRQEVEDVSVEQGNEPF